MSEKCPKKLNLGRPGRYRFVVALLVALCCLLSGSSTVVAKQALLLARFTYGTGWDALPAIVAIERGFFASEGLVVSSLSSTSPDAIANSLVVGSTDFAAVSQPTFLAMAAKGIPAKIIAIGGWGTEMELVVAPSSPITTIESLKGRTIAVTEGSEALPVLIRLLNVAGLYVEDVRIVPESSSAIINALSGNTVDAVFETRHFTKTIVQKFGARVVVSADQVRARLGLINAMPLLASDRVIANEAETVQKTTNAWVKAMTYIEQNPDDAARLLQIYLHRQGIKVPLDLVTAWVKMTNYDRVVWSPPDTADAEYNAWAAHEAGLIGSIPDLAGFVDTKFADAALRRLKGRGHTKTSAR